MLPGALPVAVVAGAPVPPPLGALADPGYLHDRARFLLHHARAAEAASLLVNRPPLAHAALDAKRWVGLELAVAHEASPDASIRIAESAGDGFAPGTDVSLLPFAVRDEYTSLMWLGGTQALWWRGDGVRAAALFRRYAGAARTPQTRAKGLYWAGRALERSGARGGSGAAARADWLAAGAYPDQFYGMLALEALGQGLPSLADPVHGAVSGAQRAAFDAAPLTQAVREVARDGDWATSIRFFRAISDAGRGEGDFVLLADLARRLGRRDLGVIAGEAAEAAGYPGFRDVAFPVIPTPLGSDWIAVHAVARQESQFAQNAVSGAGARGLMQLMPATAAEQARKLGVGYSYAGLVSDPALNIAVGNAYFTHLLGVYGGSWPLAAAAYNAGPGNVARWLRDVGDPRGGSIDWVDWIERIPLSETRGYVAHIVENAVVYEVRNPARGHYRGQDAVGFYLRGR
jgi:soluble lytic murein transglycosylase